MRQVGGVTGRKYDLMQYTGPKDAENVIVVMGLGNATVGPMSFVYCMVIITYYDE